MSAAALVAEDSPPRIPRRTRDAAAAPAVAYPPLTRYSEIACAGRGIAMDAPVMATPASASFALRPHFASCSLAVCIIHPKVGEEEEEGEGEAASIQSIVVCLCVGGE